MKAKHWIILGVIAVLCVGAAVLLYNKTSEEGVPADAGVASSVPAATEEPTATEEPAATEAPVEEISADSEQTEAPATLETLSEEIKNCYIEAYIQNGRPREEAEEMAQKYVEEYVANEQARAQEEKEPEPKRDESVESAREMIIQRYMKRNNCSREEALAWAAERDAQAEEENKRIQEHLAKEKAEEDAAFEAYMAKKEQMCLEETGMTIDEFWTEKGVQWCVDHQKEPDFLSYTGD